MTVYFLHSCCQVATEQQLAQMNKSAVRNDVLNIEVVPGPDEATECGLFSIAAAYHCTLSISANHPIFSGTVPHLRRMSRGPAKREIIPHTLCTEWHQLECDIEMPKSSSSTVTQADTFHDIYTPGAPKKLRKVCRFKKEWHIHEMLPNKRGPTFTFCYWCNAHVSIAIMVAQKMLRNI